MRPRTALLVLMGMAALLLTLGLQGCLFGGGGGGEESAEAPPTEGAEAAPPPGEMGAPPTDGAPPAEGEMGAPPGEMGAPMEGEPGAMPMEGGEMAAGGGGDAGALAQEGLALKHQGNYAEAKAKFEAAIAADPNNLVAHNGLAWILAEMASTHGDAAAKTQAIAEFNKVIELGASGTMASEAQAALQRLQG